MVWTESFSLPKSEKYSRNISFISLQKHQTMNAVSVTTQNSTIFRRLLLTFTAASNSFRFTLAVIGLFCTYPVSYHSA